uniref:Putative ABC transporter AbcA2 n=2 Tax=Thermoplasma acidophilum TaxID=2303 RepID=Q877H1_THEAI|nr:ABC transporter permease [Thermoplasma acidophilum]AAF28767.1 putative ABC transporter AbcA2 [Thermoplasma acidophilum]
MTESNVVTNVVEKKPKTQNRTIAYLKIMIKDPSAVLGLVIVVAFLGWSIIQGLLEVFFGISGPAIALLPHDPFKYNLVVGLHPPDRTYLLGTNANGEDILSRMLYAMPRDAYISIIVVLSGVLLGGLFGIIAGYRGGYLDEVIMRITDAFLSLPALILVIALSVLFHETLGGVILALVIVWWPIYARFFRAQTLRIKNLDFVQAAKLGNVSFAKLFFSYLFINSIDPVVAYAALDFGNVILTYSTLAFLGIGLEPPIPELGSMASNGVGTLPTGWWYAVFPGLAILIIVIGFVLVGDRMQDIVSNRINY